MNSSASGSGRAGPPPERRVCRVLASGFVLACMGCYEFSDVEPPREPRVPRVELGSVVPEDCTKVGEVSATGTATDDPSAAAEDARNRLRRNAAAIGANFVLLGMQTGGATSTEAITVGSSSGTQSGASWGGSSMSVTSITSDLEFAVWGTAYSCPVPAGPPQSPQGAPCVVHGDCPAGQFCAPPGHCRRP
jgi:hypothetical protein